MPSISEIELSLTRLFLKFVPRLSYDEFIACRDELTAASVKSTMGHTDNYILQMFKDTVLFNHLRPIVATGASGWSRTISCNSIYRFVTKCALRDRAIIEIMSCVKGSAGCYTFVTEAVGRSIL